MPASPADRTDANSARSDRRGTAAHHSSSWQVDLLGGLRLQRDAQELTRLPSRAVTALLARLALAPQRAHAREELIELLWPGVELNIGRNRLRQALSTLKSILEPAGSADTRPILLADRLHVRVVDGGLVCDAVQFEQAVRAGRATQALALYRGELLPGLYDEWIDEERQRLAALHDRLPMPGDAGGASTQANPPLTAHDAESTGRLAVVQLPNYLTRMFGADAQAARLRDGVLAHRLVTLIGPGGAGKTRLAVEVAHSLRTHAGWPLPVADPSEPFDLIAFVPLLGCATPAQALDALTGALQIAPQAQDPLLALTAALAGRRSLLVLDNFEQLVDDTLHVVAELLARLPELHLVVTSRRTLGLAGEHEFILRTLELPAAEATLHDAAANPAVALFVERARAVRSDFHLGARNHATVSELVRELEGMPLAIELAASRVRSIAPAEMLARLRGPGRSRLDLLSRSGQRAAADPRHASMQRAIAWSWGLLNNEQTRLLSALTAFAGGFSAAAAVALAAEPSFDAQLVLDDLVASSLVHTQVDDSDNLRFGLYQPIREFAAAQQDAASAGHWRQRLRAWALHWARALPRTPPLPALRAEMPNLLAALASAVDDGASDDAIELLLALRRCLEDVELATEGLAHAQTAVERCSDPALKARGHALLGPILFTAGQVDAALRHAEAGCAGPLQGVQRARALHSLARVRWRSRRRDVEVLPLLDEAQALMDGSSDLELRASLLALRAFVANAQAHQRASGEALHAQALALWQQLGNQHAINSGHYNLAVCAQNANRHHEALRQLEPIIASARELHDWRRLNQSLNVRGNALSGLRDWPSALLQYQECIRMAWQGMASFDLAYGLWNLPRALAHLRQPEAALRLMACASLFWRSRFGDLSAQDRHDLRRVRRLAAVQVGAARIEVLWREGEQLSPAQAVALAINASATV